MNLSWFKKIFFFIISLLVFRVVFANAISVTLTPVTEHPFPKQVTAYGKIFSPNSVDLKAQTSGRIRSIRFKAGEHVKKGQILFILDSNDIDNQTKKLLAAMQSSRDAYHRLQASYQNDPNSVSQLHLLNAKLQYKQDLSTYHAASRVEKTISPIDGIISDTNLAIGSFVNTGDTLAYIDAPNSREISYQLPSQYQSEAAINQVVTFTPNDSKKNYAARVVYVAPQLSTHDFSLTMRADFDQPNTLPANLFGTITQTLQPNAHVLAIPIAYVQTDAQGFYVYSVSNNKIDKIHFMPGEINASGLVEVRSGLYKNTEIVTSPLSNINEGQVVQISS